MTYLRKAMFILLPPNKMHSKIPGDNRQMVACRREFLETGLYLPFSNRLNDLVEEAIRNKTQPVVLDAGCGEGYYTGRVKAHLDALRNSGRVCRI